MTPPQLKQFKALRDAAQGRLWWAPEAIALRLFMEEHVDVIYATCFEHARFVEAINNPIFVVEG